MPSYYRRGCFTDDHDGLVMESAQLEAGRCTCIEACLLAADQGHLEGDAILQDCG